MVTWIDYRNNLNQEPLPEGWTYLSNPGRLSADDTAGFCKTILVTVSDPALHDDLKIVKDHLNLSGQNPLRGKNRDDLGLRFPDMSTPYTLPDSCSSLEQVVIRSGSLDTVPENRQDYPLLVNLTIMANHQKKNIIALICGPDVSSKKIISLIKGENNA